MQNEMININGESYRELRCVGCRKLIMFEYIFAGRAAYICSRCGQTSTFKFKHLPTKHSKDTINKEFTITQTEGGEK